MSLLEVTSLNSYYADSHILFDLALRVEAHEVVAVGDDEGSDKSSKCSVQHSLPPQAKMDFCATNDDHAAVCT